MAGRLTPLEIFSPCGTVRISVRIVRNVVILGLGKTEFSETTEQRTLKPINPVRMSSLPITGWAVYLSDYEPASRPIGVPFPVTVVILLFVAASVLTDLTEYSRHLPYEDQLVNSVAWNNRFSLCGSCKVDKYSVKVMHVSFSVEVVYICMVTIVHYIINSRTIPAEWSHCICLSVCHLILNLPCDHPILYVPQSSLCFCCSLFY
jgi:hypothetical protein